MVFSGERRGGREREAVVAEEEEEMERLKPQHNFDFSCLKWGNQKLLRCMKVGEESAVDRKQSAESGAVSGGGEGGGSVIGTRRREMELERRFRSSNDRKMESYCKFSSSEKLKARAGDGEIEATREKLILDFQTEVGKMKDAILRGSLLPPTKPAPATPAATTTSPVEKPWNLRTRRAACKAPDVTNGVHSNGDILKPNVSPVRNDCNRSPIHRHVGGDAATATTNGEKRDRPKFSISLTRREVEDDFTAMAGRRQPRKPKKRPKIIQKQLDTLFPGLWLTEITADLYRVPDDIESGKR